MKYKKSCPCGEQSKNLIQTAQTHSGNFYRCEKCDLQFTDHADYEEKFLDFSAAGKVFFKNISQDKIINQLTPSELYIYQWVTQHIPKKTLIVELYCEIGRLLYCLKLNGYNVLGVDPIDNHINLLAENGMDCITPRQFSEKYIEGVAVIICVESIVRLKSPNDLFASLQAKYKDAKFIVTAPSENRSVLNPYNYCNFDRPPNHLTRWSKKSLNNIFNSPLVFVDDIVVNFNPSPMPKLLKKIIAFIYKVIGEGKYSYVVIKN